MYLPSRTPSTSAKPSACRLPSTALPAGSSTPGFRVTYTRASMSPPVRHPRACRGSAPPLSAVRGSVDPCLNARLALSASTVGTAMVTVGGCRPGRCGPGASHSCCPRPDGRSGVGALRASPSCRAKELGHPARGGPAARAPAARPSARRPPRRCASAMVLSGFLAAAHRRAGARRGAAVRRSRLGRAVGRAGSPRWQACCFVGLLATVLDVTARAIASADPETLGAAAVLARRAAGRSLLVPAACALLSAC